MKLFASTLIAALISTVLLFVLRPAATAMGLVDRPGGRKNHDGVVPVYGGVAMFAGVLVTAFMSTPFGFHGYALLGASAFMVALGVLDDRHDLRPRLRLLAHAFAAVGLVIGTGFLVPDLGDLLGVGTLPLGVATWPFTIVACVALINAFNMLDGLDGLAGGVALMAFGGIIGIGCLRVAPVSLLISCCMVGSLLAFLAFNMPAPFNRQRRVFMGDAGSTLLGFLLAGISLTLVQSERADVPPVIILWLMPIPIFELFSSTFRRLRSGASVAVADAGHYHHRLLRAGFSVQRIFVIYLLTSACCAAIAVLSLWLRLPERILAAAFVAVFAVWTAFVTRAGRAAAR